MKVVTETFYCDKCGVGPATNGNVPYLGWVFIETSIIGLIGDPLIHIHLCSACFGVVRKFIRGESNEG